jgi:hypothetical protein
MILTIRFPEDFEERYNKYKARFESTQNEISNDEPVSEKHETNKSSKPHVFVKNGQGYLVLSGEEIGIGDKDSGKFRVLEKLCLHFSVPQSIDSIYEYMGSKKGGLTKDAHIVFQKDRKLALIESQFREVKRIMKTHREQIKKIKRLSQLQLKREKETLWLVEK